MFLDRKQRNEMYEAIAAQGADPGDFDFTQDATSATISHLSSNARLYLVRDSADRVWVIEWNAGQPGEAVGEQSLEWSFSAVIDAIGQWLRAIAEDERVPDLWAELERQQRAFSSEALGSIENTPFTVAEQREIAAKLDELKLYANRTYELSGEQMRDLEARLDYVADAATRVGRLDWRNLMAGTLLGGLSGAYFPPEAVRGIVGAVVSSVAHLFGMPVPQLPS